MLGQEPPGWREGEASSAAFDERQAHLAFERGELHRHSRRGQVQGAGDGGDRAEMVKFGEHAQFSNVQHINHIYAADQKK
ncbi:hypothetical protein GCM10022381_38870 [Leifsonia kafniensis]|uniref:Uncharacterized protein n=1 Tax=Leifsonia kafniensis TaxID=475957 RepID=A0ABP7L315_9MICO